MEAENSKTEVLTSDKGFLAASTCGRKDQGRGVELFFY